MKEVWLYPTETIYALGVNAFDTDALALLAKIKGRPVTQAVSCLVRSAADIERYAVVSPVAKQLIQEFLPGPLTIILPTIDDRLRHVSVDGTASFRISPDKYAQQAIKEFMDIYDAPLTCTSANKHGQTPARTPHQILKQLGPMAQYVTKVMDDGPRSGLASTVVRCLGEEVEIIRPGAISPGDIFSFSAGRHG